MTANAQKWFLLVVVLWGSSALAQFDNRSVGLGVGYLSFNNTDATADWGLPVSIEGTFYIDGGWDALIKTGVMVLTEKATALQVIALNVESGVRYFFLQERWRPYVGANAIFLHIFRSNGTTSFFGLGPNAGLDFFFADNGSIGVRGFYNVHFALNTPVTTTAGAQLVAATHF